MSIYELEERVYFDGAIAADIEDMSNQDSVDSSQLSADNDSAQNITENVAIAEGQCPVSSEQTAGVSDSDGTDTEYSDIAQSGDSTETEDVQITNSTDTLDDIFDNLNSSDLSDISEISNLNSEINNVLLVSAENEIVYNISSLINDNTVLVEYSADDSVETILENINAELGDSKAVNIGIVDSSQLSVDSGQPVETCGNTSFSLAELTNALQEFQTVDGTVDVINFELGGESVDPDLPLTEFFNTESSQFDSLFGDVLPHDSTTPSTLSPLDSSTDLYFIDLAIEDGDVLIEEITSENPDAIIVELSEGEGLESMTYIVNQYTDIDSVHILSQANYAQILLGDDVITDNNIGDYQEAFSSWSDNLTNDADILFYGCDIAKEAQGQSVLNQIAEWTGADIAASTDITGGADGDWDLEYTTSGRATSPQGADCITLDTAECGSLGTDTPYLLDSSLIEASAIAAVDYNPHLETYTVTEITDDGTGTVEGSLSWAITESNATTDIDDTINFNLLTGDTITISGQLTVITDSVDIDGTNEATGNGITITVGDQSTSEYRVFEINAVDEIVSICNMTINGGSISEYTGYRPTEDNYGGGIYIKAGMVTLDTIIISGSTAYRGGGVYIENSTVEFESCLIMGNIASGDNDDINAYGGGICAGSSAITIENSVISENETQNSGYGSRDYGGGIYLSGSSIEITNSTVDKNIAYHGGAGLYGGGTTIKFINSTFSHNIHGGAIAVVSAQSVEIVSCTIANNFCNGYYDTQAGGIYVGYAKTFLVINSTISGNEDHGVYLKQSFIGYFLNSIIVNNTDGDVTSYSSSVYAYYCWVNNYSARAVYGSNFISASLSDLGELQNNGGFTKTIALSSESLAVGEATYAYYNSEEGYYYFVDDDGVSHQLNEYFYSPEIVESEKIVKDQRGVAIVANPSPGACYTETIYYKTVSDGDWDDVSIWESSADGITWKASIDTPDALNSYSISIESDIIVTENIEINQTTVTITCSLTIGRMERCLR